MEDGMKAIISGLPELVGENQTLLGRLVLITMHANGFKVDDVHIEFQPDNGSPLPPAPDAYRRN
jgi:hypothetical protein